VYAVTLETVTLFGGEGTVSDTFEHTIIVSSGGAATPPVVEIVGAPASSGEGTEISLDSSVTLSCGTIESYAWSVNGGPFTAGTASDGPTFSFSPDDNGTYVVSLAVTVDGETTTVFSDDIVVTNLAPAITTLSLTQPIGGGPAVTLAGSFTDPGTADDFNVHIVWESGATDDIPVAASPSGSHSFTIDHTYTSTGDKPIAVTVSDDDGGTNAGSASASVQVALSATGTLGVVGTSADDSVTITAPTIGTVRLQGSILGGPIDFAAASVTRLLVKLGGGNDIVINATTEAMIAVGGAGTDIITDAGGRGILIGGAGSDILYGGGGQDILIDSGTDHDADDAALLALLAYWNDTSHSLSTRVNNIRNGNGVPALNSTTIHGDGVFDLLIGGGGTDWILLHSEDFSLGFSDILEDLDDL
jgi:hypothetical protein